jgi:hypothetical protein
MVQKEIPITIKTSLANVIMSIYELNSNEGEKLCVIAADDGQNMTIMGCECLSDIIFYSDYFHRFDKSIDPENLTVMRALIADPTDLPFCLPPAASIFILNDNVGMEKFDYVYEATEYIEDIMGVWPRMEIKDFAVLIGIELSIIIKARIIKKIEEKRLEKMESQSVMGG